MDHLWTPWRYTYINKNEPEGAKDEAGQECIFCQIAASDQDEQNLVVFRGRLNFILLNLYPYTNGHLMVAPYKHVATLGDAGDDVLTEMMLLTGAAERHLRGIYKPEGLNLGMNIGKCAGAGVAGHIHMHVLPRWVGDANFMSTVGETRVMPEEVPETYRKVRAAFLAG